MSLRIEDIHFSYGDRPVLHGVTLEVGRGVFTGLLGPNGSGKSTLTKILARVHVPSKGTVALEGTDLLSLPRREHAKRVAYVPQSSEVPFELTVRESVLLGRTPYMGLRPKPADIALVEESIERLDLGELRDRRLSELSGGQAQRALIARALAQEPEVLLLDEPTSALDLRYQVDTLSLVRQVTREQGVAALIAIHDLNHAALFCDEIALLHGGSLVAWGAPEDAMRAETLSEVYGLPVHVERRDGAVEVRPVLSAEQLAGATVTEVTGTHVATANVTANVTVAAESRPRRASA